MASGTAGIEELTARIAKAAAGKKGFGKAIALDMGDEGAIRLNGYGETVEVDNQVEPADCTISLTPKTLEKLMAGSLSAPYAFMTGKVKIKGEMVLATELAKFI